MDRSLRYIDPTFSDLISTSRNGKYTVKFKDSQSYQLVGKSGAGKSFFTHHFLINASEMINSTRNIEILYCYKEYQKRFDQMKSDLSNISFHNGLLTNDEIFHEYATNRDNHLIIVIDDLMVEAMESQDLLDLFCIYCHHKNCSVIMMSHNLYQKGKYSKTLALNAGYVVLFETPACIDQIKVFGRQRFPFEKDILLRAYSHEVLSKKYGYVVVDMTVNVPRELKIRAGIFPQEQTVFYF